MLGSFHFRPIMKVTSSSLLLLLRFFTGFWFPVNQSNGGRWMYLRQMQTTNKFWHKSDWKFWWHIANRHVRILEECPRGGPDTWLGTHSQDCPECLNIWPGSGRSQTCLINVDLHSEELLLSLECWGTEELICLYKTGELLLFLLHSQPLRGGED